jgi:hypothetical protein
MATKQPARRERRRGPRTRLYGFSALNVTAEVSVIVRDVGPESFAVESPIPFDIGTELEFQFSSYGLNANVAGVVRRCEKFVNDQGSPRYVIGLAAAYRSPADRTVMSGCVGALKSASAVRALR